MRSKTVKLFSNGTHNLLDPEIIPADAAQDSRNWITRDGRIQLSNGKIVVGANGASGNCTGEIFGYKVDGTNVHWRKVGTVIQYLNGTTWTDVVTGLTATADYAFANYSSLAGTFTYAFGIDGIYKLHNANPGSYLSMYDSAKNFKGLAIIDRGRTILWNRPEDKTGLYGSKIDGQRTGVQYTQVTAETLGTGDGTDLTFSGTLAFKSGGATRNGFAFAPYVVSGETFKDNYDGTLTGSAGGTGTINYLTGAWTLTFTVAPAAAANNIKANYLWEDSNSAGLTDFTKSATRLAGEGFQFPQDQGGDAIISVHVGPDGAYYSLKETSAYRLELEATDLSATNDVYRNDLGIKSYRGAISTSQGIVFMNTANPERPVMTILKKNQVQTDIIPDEILTHYDFSLYDFSDCTFDSYDRYVLVACKTVGAATNNVILLCNVKDKTVDATYHYARTFAKNDGDLFMGSSITQSTYKLYNGFDDEGDVIPNSWTGKNENLGNEDGLNKIAKLRFKGRIAARQGVRVFLNFDRAGAQEVGTILGSGPYVDYTDQQTVGSNMVGSTQVGGDNIADVYPFYREIKLRKVPKFKTVAISFEALGFGHVEISEEMYFDQTVYEHKIPARFRVKQNESIDGTVSGQAHP